MRSGQRSISFLLQLQSGDLILPSVSPPCFGRKHLGRQIGFASRPVHPATLAHMPYVRTPRVEQLCCSCNTSKLYIQEKAQHGTVQQHRQNNGKQKLNIPARKNKSPSLQMKNKPPRLEHLAPVKNENNSNSQSFSLNLIRRPSPSRPPRHRFGRVKPFLLLCHSEPRRPPRVKPCAHRGSRSPARQCWCSDCVNLSVNFTPVAKISTV